MDFSELVRQPKSAGIIKREPSTKAKQAIEWPLSVNTATKEFIVCDTKEKLVEGLAYCVDYGICSLDWETGPTEEAMDKYVALINDETSRLKFAQKKTVINEIKKEIEALKKAALKTPLDPQASDICTFSFSYRPNESYVVFLAHDDGGNIDCGREEALNLLNDMVLKNEKVLKIAYNMAFEAKFAAKRKHYFVGAVADPMMMIIRVLQVLTPNDVNNEFPYEGKGLKAMAKRYLGLEMGHFDETLAAQNAEFFNECSTSDPRTISYSAEDSDASLQLYLMLRDVAMQIPTESEMCPTYNDWLHKIDMPFTRVTALMEFNGLGWDTEVATKTAAEATEKLEAQRDKIIAIGARHGKAIDPGKTGKTGDLNDFLFITLRAPIAAASETTGKASMSYECLLDIKFMVENGLISLDQEEEFHSHPEKFDSNYHKYKADILELLESLIVMATMSTLLSTHIVGREKWVNMFSHKIHARYEPWCDTGRLSSSSPNGQNVPRPENDEFGIRNLYDVPKGKVMVLVDFSGFELRIIAWKSNDETMLDLFNNGGDMHMRTAMTLTGKEAKDVLKQERAAGKTGNFAVTYGGTEWSLRTTFKTQYGIRHGLDYCAAIIQAIYKTYPGIVRFQEEAAEFARTHGYIETIYGFRRILPYINSATKSYRKADERKAANTPIQGSAADIMKNCQNQLYDSLGRGELPGVEMCAQIHDEIIFICDDDVAVVENLSKKLKEVMEMPPLPGFPVKIEVDISAAYKWGKKMPVAKWIASKQ